MELKEFISETIQQISLGVKDAMDKCSELDVIVNPDITIGSDGDYYVPENKNTAMQRRVQILDIAVTVTNASETSGGGKIGVSIFGANINSSGKSENTNVSRVKFSIPVCLPITKMNLTSKSSGVSCVSPRRSNKP